MAKPQRVTLHVTYFERDMVTDVDAAGDEHYVTEGWGVETTINKHSTVICSGLKTAGAAVDYAIKWADDRDYTDLPLDIEVVCLRRRIVTL